MAWITVGYKTREIASFVPVKQPMSSFARNTYLTGDISNTFLLFLLFSPHFFIFLFFIYIILFRVTSNFDEVFYPLFWRYAPSMAQCNYEKRFYTLFHGWKSINRLKLSRDILYWIALRYIRYSISWILCKKTIIYLSSLFSIGKIR